MNTRNVGTGYHISYKTETAYDSDLSMKVAGLFAGIGGIELAFSRAGFETVLLAESDPAAQSVLKSHFPEVELFGDVELLNALPSEVKIVTAGFPCQNLSMAGDKSGIVGKKSGVVSNLFRLIKEAHAPTVVVENVYFMLHLDRGKAMDWLLTQFEDLGYAWAYRVLDTRGFGVPQRRRRVYLVASKVLDPREVLFAEDKPKQAQESPDLSNPIGFYWTEGRSGVGLTANGIPPIKGGSGIGIPSPPAVLFPDGHVLKPDIVTCEALQGFPRQWTQAANGNRNPRWRLIGNAVSVPVAEWVAANLKTPRPALKFKLTPISEFRSWPDAGFGNKDGRFGVPASDKPIKIDSSTISAYRTPAWSQLSARALRGFLSRAREGGLSFPEGFLGALEGAYQQVSCSPLEILS